MRQRHEEEGEGSTKVLWDNNLPHVGTSSSADEVCSSVDGFFFPSPMILVIFFPAPFPTVPDFCSDFEFFFPFPEIGTEITNLIHDLKQRGGVNKLLNVLFRWPPADLMCSLFRQRELLKEMIHVHLC